MLPPELFFEVFSYLTYEEAEKASRVCKFFEEIFNDETYQRYLYLLKYEEIDKHPKLLVLNSWKERRKMRETVEYALYCVICRKSLFDSCIECDNYYKCNIEFNTVCDHVFHTHCIRRWLKRRPCCPLCSKEWKVV